MSTLCTLQTEMCAKMNEYVVTEMEKELEHSVCRVLALSNTV